MPSKISVVRPRRSAKVISQPPAAPMAAPARPPNPICSAVKTTQFDCTLSCTPPTATHAKNRTAGSANPSLTPLSTINALRKRSGTRRLVTTAWPSAASVGARIAAKRAISQPDQSGIKKRPAMYPKSIASGNPIPNIRSGTRAFARTSRARSIAASANSTSTRVISATRWSKPSRCVPSRPRSSAIIRPKPIAIIGPVTTLWLNRCATSA